MSIDRGGYEGGLQGGPAASGTAICAHWLARTPRGCGWGGGRGSPRDFGAVSSCLDGKLSDFEAILSDFEAILSHFQAIWGDLRCSMQVPHNERGDAGERGRMTFDQGGVQLAPPNET